MHCASATTRCRRATLQAHSRVRDALQRHEQERKNARFIAWLARYDLCRAAERQTEPADALRERWSTTPASDIAAERLEQRFAAALDARVAVAIDEEPFRELLLELEFLAGVGPRARPNANSGGSCKSRACRRGCAATAKPRGSTSSACCCDAGASSTLRRMQRWTPACSTR